MSTLASSFSILTQPGVFLYLLRGVAFTCILSVLGVILGLILGSLLALARTYCKKGPAHILGWFSAAYIELFRNTPYLLWIFVCVVFCPCPAFFARKMFGLTSVEMKLLFKAALALILFNSSVIAEIVRGGLNGVAKGQFEAGYAQGFNTAEVLLYIILPQAYRNIVPTLLSQVITTIKDSSYLANVATIELMARIRQLLREPTADAAVLTCFYRTLQLGFVGQYRAEDDERREDVAQALGARVPPFSLTQEAPVVVRASRLRSGRRMYWCGWAAGIVALAALWLTFSSVLSQMVAQIAGQG
jgi:putative glutamine transport system permease protein